jgi:ethanolamine permease
MSMLSLFRLRAAEPHLNRTFRVPFYPLFPALALMLAVVALVAMIYFNLKLFWVFVGFMALGYVYFMLTARQRAAAPVDALLDGTAG